MLVPLASLPWIGETEMLGLANGSLYEVLDVDSGQGLTKVNAKGFNITCGYLSGVHTGMGNSTDVNRVKATSWEIVLDTHNIGELSIFDTSTWVVCLRDQYSAF
jgi:hypothetical protein